MGSSQNCWQAAGLIRRSELQSQCCHWCLLRQHIPYAGEQSKDSRPAPLVICGFENALLLYARLRGEQQENEVGAPEKSGG